MSLIGDLLLVCSRTEAERILQPALDAALRVELPRAQEIDPTNTGTVFMYWRVGDTDNVPFVVLHGGYVPPEKDSQHTENAMQMLDMLIANPSFFSTVEGDEDDDKEGLYGGGLNFGKRVVYISAGLNPWFGELVICTMAWGLGHTTIEEMRRIANRRGNLLVHTYIQRLERSLRR